MNKPKLRLVTITGADDSTDIQELIDLSEEFPFVEWGILLSYSQEGGYRFPTRDWINKLIEKSADLNMNFSTHLCGKWVRELLNGELNWIDIPEIVDYSQRFQINTHAQPHIFNEIDFLSSFLELVDYGILKEIIFQWDGVNNGLAYLANKWLDPEFLKVNALFDTSGGAGILPKNWPQAPEDIKVGFAGGLSSDNVVEQLSKIRCVAKQDFWIDMERKVRTENDSSLDMIKIKKVLTLMKNEVNR